MIEDAAARALLDESVVEWTEGDVLGPLCEVVRTVWRTNVDRYEPVKLGDDAVSIGVQSSRNVCNLAVRRLATTPGVQARDAKTLVINYRGRVLHSGKIGSRSRSWDVSSVDWSLSDVRTTCAEANTKAYVPVEGTLFEGVGPVRGQPDDPRVLRHLLLVWQGFDDGSIRVWLGFPRLGTPPWFAVVLVDNGSGGRGGVPADGDSPVPPMPDFDSLDAPSVDIARRPERKPWGA
ncbi:MAG: hypothetical protein GEV09_23540 [Pseudonocardiaceae bacterium]|nr:hypothetical protein [Pseudonocardiaceae bacterium]